MLNNSNNTSPYEEESDNGDKYTDSTLKSSTETAYNQSKYNTNSTANSKYARSAYNNNNNNNYNNNSTNNTSNSKYARSTYNNNSNDNKYPYKNKYDKYNNNENSKYSRSSYNNNDSNNQSNNYSNSKYSPSNSTEPRSYNKYSNQYSNYNNNSNKSKYDQRKTSYTNNNQHERQPSQTKETDSIDELSQGISSLSTNDDKHLKTKPANTCDEDDQVKVIECNGLSIEEVNDIFNKYESMRGGYGVKSINEEQILIVFGHTSTGSRAWQENNNNSKIQVFKGSMDLVKDVIPIRKSAMSQKPTSSNMVARRLIHGALGMKAPIRTEAQKKADQKLLDTARSERNAKREN